MMTYTQKEKDDLLCTRAYEVVQNLGLQKIESRTEKPTQFHVSRHKILHKDDVKREIMRLGNGEPTQTNFTFIERVFKQIIYYLKFSE